MKFFSKEQKQLVIDTLRNNRGDVGRTAKMVGISESEVNWVEKIMVGSLAEYVKGKGNPKLYPYIIGIRDRREDTAWDNNSPKIKKARELYNQGLVEVVNGYDDNNIILYCIPRRNKDEKRRPWFVKAEEEKKIELPPINEKEEMEIANA